jgi:uncharacterized repeat protein (TIGR01451 family)
MLARKLPTVILALGVLGITTVAFAQSDGGQEKEPSFFDRVDNLGKSILSPIFSDDKPKPKPKPKDTDAPTAEPRASAPDATATAPANDNDPSLPPASGERMGSILSASTPAQRTTTSARLAANPDATDATDNNLPPAIPGAADGTSQAMRRAPADSSLLSDVEPSEKPSQQPSAPLPGKSTSDVSNSLGSLSENPIAAKPSSQPAQPLHQRLSSLRQSPFDADGGEEAVSQPEAPRGQASDAPAPPSTATEAAASKPAPLSTAPESKVPTPARRPLVAERTKPGADAGLSAPAASSSDSAASLPITTEKTPVATEKAPIAVEKAPIAVEKAPAATEKAPAAAQDASAAKSDTSDVLVTRKGPAINVETLGPRRISVGKESTYEVDITNSGEVAGEDLIVFVSLPVWAEVVGAEATSGTAQVNATGQVPGTVQWKLGHLDAKGHEQLTLKIIPRQSRPFDLAVRWESRPMASQAMIEVQEPKLILQLEGPREVLYGKKEVYRLKLTNVGNGNAENVSILLMPIGGGENVPAAHKIGVLAAGAEKLLDVELTARQAGNLTIQVDARADSGVHTELAEKVLVRRANLRIDAEGPRVQFVGAAATYAIHIRNTGTAQAQNVHMSLVLPAGIDYISGIENARLDSSKRKIEWTIEAINPDAEQHFVLKCSLGAAGVTRLQVAAAGADDLAAAATVITRVDAVANLVLDVTDPQGPVAIGEEATYEIRVRNRGTREAENVQVFVYFSRGIEPTGAEGAPNRLAPGQVLFQPITSLAAGAEAVFKVRAKAELAGNHVFRAEAHCKPLGARLVREATNLYYADATPGPQGGRELNAERPAVDAMRTVTRPSQGDPTMLPPRK